VFFNFDTIRRITVEHFLGKKKKSDKNGYQFIMNIFKAIGSVFIYSECHLYFRGEHFISHITCE